MGCFIPVKGEVLEIDPPATHSELLTILRPYDQTRGRSHWKSVKIRDGSAWIADTFATKENPRVMNGMDVEDPTMCGTVLYLSARECSLMQEEDGIQKARALDGVPMLPIHKSDSNLTDNTKWKLGKSGCIFHSSTRLWWAPTDTINEMTKLVQDGIL